MTQDQLLKLHKTESKKCREIMQSKNDDYAEDKDALSNFKKSEVVGVEPARSILVRVVDKIQRINSFIDKGELSVKDESVDDAIRDIINYMILLRATFKEQSEGGSVAHESHTVKDRQVKETRY